MIATEPNDEVLAIEVFAAKDLSHMMLTVPHGCGLSKADTLLMKDGMLVATKQQEILPLVFPELDSKTKGLLVSFSKSGKDIPVGEFLAVGLVDSYSLKFVVA